MISSRLMTIAGACVAAAGGIVIGLGAASTADAAVRVADPHAHSRQTTRAGGRDVNNNRHFREIATINPIRFNDVADNTNISRDGFGPPPAVAGG